MTSWVGFRYFETGFWSGISILTFEVGFQSGFGPVSVGLRVPAGFWLGFGCMYWGFVSFNLI